MMVSKETEEVRQPIPAGKRGHAPIGNFGKWPVRDKPDVTVAQRSVSPVLLPYPDVTRGRRAGEQGPQGVGLLPAASEVVP